MKHLFVPCVYKITSPTGRVYVGSTTNKERRFKEYKRHSMKHQHKLLSSFKKYGFENHKTEIIWTGDLKDMLTKEVEMGNKYSVLDKYLGLNLRLPKHGEYNNISEETRENLKVSRLGKSAYWNNVPLKIFDIKGEFIKHFKSIKECSIELGCSTRLIKNAVSGGTRIVLSKYQIRLSDTTDNIGVPTPRKIRNDTGCKRIKK